MLILCCLLVIRDLVLFVKKCLVIMGQELTGCLNAPVVFAHNDLLSGNLMFNDDEGIHSPNMCFFAEPLTVPSSHYVLLISLSLSLHQSSPCFCKNYFEPEIYFCRYFFL